MDVYHKGFKKGTACKYLYQKLGIDQPMYFKMDLFTGCRFGLFYYSTEQTGGYVDFSKFQFIWPEYVY